MSVDLLKNNLRRFKRKYHTNKLIRGGLFAGIIATSILLIFSILESYFWFNTTVRTILFGIGIVLLLYVLISYIVLPLLGLFRLKGEISDEQAALEIGRYFPEIEDKLLNYLQLSRISQSDSSLINAALHQKINQLRVFSFDQAISFKVNLRYVYYFSGLLVFILLVSFISPNLITDSTTRILQFNRAFEKPSPFTFNVVSELVAFTNDQYELVVEIEGDYVPEATYLLENNRQFRMKQTGNRFSFNFPAVSREKRFQLEAAGYRSKTHILKVHNRPEIKSLQVAIDYPAYTGIRDQTKSNTGSMIVPEGSKLTWIISSSDAEDIHFITESDSLEMQLADNQQYELSKVASRSFNYELKLQNQYAANQSKIAYEVSVIKDEAPTLDVEFIADTITYRSLIVSGNITDDYGFTRLYLNYKTQAQQDYGRIPISFDRKQNIQQFFYQWDFDSLELSSENYLEAYVSVFDNDAINGYKRTVSKKFFLKMPDKAEVQSMIEEKSAKSQNNLELSIQEAKELNQQLEDLDNRLKNKKELDWQDKKLLKDLLEKKEKLNQQIDEMKKQHEQLAKSQKEFNQQSKKLQEKTQQLQELINEVMDEETKKLYDELQKLLEEESTSEEVMKQLSQVQQKEKNLEKELERALELFKRMKLETTLEQTASELQELGEKQEELGEKTESDPTNANDKKEQQEELNKSFESVEKKLDQANELNKELKNPEQLDKINQDRQEIAEDLDEIDQDLDSEQEKQDQQESNDDAKSPKSQQMKKTGQKMKNAGQKMKQAGKKLSQMQQGAEMIMMQENLDHLRDILDNLIKLSFEQEAIIKETREVQQIDPRFIELSQEQLALINNAEVIEDSLLSLAGRVVQISSFVTREVGEINHHLDNTMFELRERNKGKAASHQQFAMTSMNNLALLLDDVLSQMQMSMAESMGQPKPNGEKPSLPSMSEMQKQLSEQIQQLKQSGKSGRQLSEELARLAAEQAELRQQLEEMQGQQPVPGEENGEEDGGSGDQLKEAIEKMEENEVDLVNKRITQQLIDRQQEIITRMLEAEESMREQKESPEREGETASDQSRSMPPAIEEYLKARQKEVELLKTIPLDLNPFYKKEVNEYFKRLSLPQQ